MEKGKDWVDITLYSTHCPKCVILEKKLILNDIKFDIIDDENKVMEFAEKHNIQFIPILVIGDRVYDFSQAIRWIDNYREEGK